MNFCVMRADNKAHFYTSAQLRSIAKRAASGHGTLTGYWVSFLDNVPHLVAQYAIGDGWHSSVSVDLRGIVN